MNDDMMGDDLLGNDDLLGEELLGDDLVGKEILGAWRRRQRKKKQAVGRILRAKSKKDLVKRAILAKKIAAAKVIETDRPTHARVQSMGLSQLAVQPRTT